MSPAKQQHLHAIGSQKWQMNMHLPNEKLDPLRGQGNIENTETARCEEVSYFITKQVWSPK